MAKRIEPETKEYAMIMYKDGVPALHIAEHLGVSVGSVYRWWRRWNGYKLRVIDTHDKDYPGEWDKRVWYLMDYHKGKHVGQTYKTKAAAEKALFSYL